MTSFARVDYPAEHPGVVRAEAFVETVSAVWGRLKATYSTARGLSTILVAGAIAALVLVADQLVDTWVDGHLFAAWVALWTLVFATLAVFAPLIKGFIDEVGQKFEARRENAAQHRNDVAYLASARSDPRVMAELRAAIWRHEANQLEALGRVVDPIEMPSLAQQARPMLLGHLRYI